MSLEQQHYERAASSANVDAKEALAYAARAMDASARSDNPSTAVIRAHIRELEDWLLALDKHRAALRAVQAVLS